MHTFQVPDIHHLAVVVSNAQDEAVGKVAEFARRAIVDQQ
jgi:hypothetical protein